MVEDIKYLDVFLNSDFHDNTDVQSEMRAIYARGNIPRANMVCERDTEKTSERISMKFGGNVLWYMLLT
jgi:hypothetical protein